jgi:hypothetical protein
MGFPNSDRAASLLLDACHDSQLRSGIEFSRLERDSRVFLGIGFQRLDFEFQGLGFLREGVFEGG